MRPFWFTRSILFLFLPLSGLILLSLPDRISAQDVPINTEFQTAVSASSMHMPFWLYANRYGQINPDSEQNVLGLLSVSKPFTSSSGFDYSAGVTTAFRASDTANSVHFQQLFAGISYGAFKLRVGRFYDDGEMLLPHLSTGSMMFSRNATPHPRIMVTTRDFVDVPFTDGVVQFRGMYGDGLMESDRFIKDPLVHQKSLHLKFNFWRMELITGFFHNVMWGGTDRKRGQVPQRFSDYLRVVFAQSADPGSGATVFEEINRLGNSVSSYDGALIVDLPGADLIAYRQIYLEDSVSLQLRSYMDGLYGLGLTNIEGINLFDSILIEHLNTIRQDSQGDNPRGRANYYNHYAYQTGWAYYGSAMGNPLLTYNRDLGRFRNNMVLAWHLGIGGSPSDFLSYRLTGTYSRNYGTCRDDLMINGSCFVNQSNPPDENFEFRPRREVRRDQYSFMFEATMNVLPEYGVSVFSALAVDTGEHLGDSFGIMAGITIRDFHKLRRR